ncbi:uncharacterized protein LOC123873410 [Maniola jurtina]|uniref:uncharacterized protein LOC123873410 n=1 Tax=Maniola jurtina TaxID=191418 RepID=UPI001E68AB25|nr:uncharacterized protein LOC123873410 [Maniola jurtina]
MPLTPAERQRKYREKLKRENPIKYDEMKKKTAKCALRYYKKKVSQYTEEEKIERRKKWQEERKRQKQADQAKVDISKPAKTQKDIEYKLRRKNKELQKENKILRNRFNALRKKFYRQSKKLDELNLAFLEFKKTETNQENQETDSDSVTPMKQTESFIKENLPKINTQQKEIVKKKILEHNVLVKSLRNEYKESDGTQKNTIKKIVTNDVVKKYKLKTKLKNTLGLKSNIRTNRDRKIRKQKLFNEIKNFYDRDDNSRATAGKKEYRTKNKIKRQIRYLLELIKKLHQKYVAEGGKASLSTFKKYRPFYVLKPKISDRDTCACVKHSNMAFMVKKLKQLTILESDDLSEITSKFVCDITSNTCMYGLCESCKDKVIITEDQINLNEEIVWPVWMLKKHEYCEEGHKKTTKKMVKTVREGTIQDLINAFHSDMKNFLIHSYNISHQYKSYKFCIANLKDNETVIHIDFSENYTCKLHTEIQALHFGASKVQITLHTGVLYIKDHDRPTSFCSISPANVHSPEAIWAHLTPILQYLKITYPQVDTLHFFSDGPTSQYRNKKNFYLFSQIETYGFEHATWSFFEAAHGKGAADGIGGAVKRTLDSKVAHGEDIPDAKTAYEVLSEKGLIKMFYIPPEDIKVLQEELIENLKPLPNTLKIHQVIFKDKNAVNFRNLSCFCKNMSGKCDCYSTKTHRFEINKDAQPRNTVKRKLNTIKRSKVGTKKRRESTASTTESDCTEIEYLDDSDATHFSETYQEEYLELDENNQEEYLESGENILRERQEKRAEKGSGKTDFENEGLEVRRLVENIDEKIKEVQIEKKTASQKGVTILSDIRNSPWNKRYFDLKRCGGLQFKKVDSNFDLCSLKKSLDVPISTENIDPYKNPVASSSGIKTKTENQKTKDFEENRKTYFSSLNKGDQTKNIEEDFEGKARYDIKDSIKTNEIKEEGRQNSGVISIVEANKNENTKVYDESDVKIKINQYVLVRYYIRKTWKYYIGRVVEIHTKDEDTNYTINFLKTIKKPSLRFTTPKKMDTDTVPSLSIVKTIELNEEDNKKNEYLLKDDFNETYFEL